MTKFDRAMIMAVFMVCAFAGGILTGLWLQNYRSEMEMLRRRVQAAECVIWEWKGELDALKEIGVELRVVDTSAHLNALWVLEYQAQQKERNVR